MDMVNIGPIMKGIRLSFIDSTIRLEPKLWAYEIQITDFSDEIRVSSWARPSFTFCSP